MEEVVIQPGDRHCIPTGITVVPPKGTYIRIAPRSSMSLKGVDVQAGVVDRGYRGEIKVLLSNSTSVPYQVSRLSRIAQLVIEKIADIDDIIPIATLDSLPPSDRDTKGFGSTNKVEALAAVATVENDDEFPALPEPTDEPLDVEAMIDTQDESERRQIAQLLRQYEDLFSAKPSVTSAGLFTFDTRQAKPIRLPPFRTSPQEDAVQLQTIKEMLDANVIEPSSSPWGARGFFVKKKDGSLRWVIDYRQLNAVTVRDAFPLPRIEDCLDQLQGSQYFSTLDLKSGYWQVPIDPETRPQTAFNTKFGVYHFLVMPFGLANAPAYFTRMMMDLFPSQHWPYVLIYLDDINIHSKLFRDHLSHVQAVLDKLRAVNMRLNRKKCHFAAAETSYLGFRISRRGIQPEETRIEAINKYPAPTNQTEIRRFLGLFASYRRFIPDAAKIAEPLNRLLRKDSVWHWDEEQQEAFGHLKRAISSAPVLAYPDFTKEFTVETDASKTGIGAVLTQMDGKGRPHPVCYASRSLNPAERNYSTTERECLAIVWATRIFRPYLMGPFPFRILVDHAPLTALRTTRDPTSRLARWALHLQQFNFTIQYKPGVQNKVADALSRLPIENFTLITEAKQTLQALETAKLPASVLEAASVLSQLLDKSQSNPSVDALSARVSNTKPFDLNNPGHWHDAVKYLEDSTTPARCSTKEQKRAWKRATRPYSTRDGKLFVSFKKSAAQEVCGSLRTSPGRTS
jgi:deoxyuridine 5'-triphosphate nucleotidohydrolase